MAPTVYLIFLNKLNLFLKIKSYLISPNDNYQENCMENEDNNKKENLVKILEKLIRESFSAEEKLAISKDNPTIEDPMDAQKTVYDTPKFLTPYKNSKHLNNKDFVEAILNINKDPEQANLSSPNNPTRPKS